MIDNLKRQCRYLKAALQDILNTRRRCPRWRVYMLIALSTSLYWEKVIPPFPISNVTHGSCVTGISGDGDISCRIGWRYLFKDRQAVFRLESISGWRSCQHIHVRLLILPCNTFLLSLMVRSVDVERVWVGAEYFHEVWASVLSIALSIIARYPRLPSLRLFFSYKTCPDFLAHVSLTCSDYCLDSGSHLFRTQSQLPTGCVVRCDG
jgi:hypothetical protein